VQPVGPLAGGTLLEHAGVGDAQLRSQMRSDRPWDVGEVGQERAEEPHGADLDSEPEAVVLAAADVHELACSGVEMEVAVELRLVGVTGVPAVAALLLRGEKPLARRIGGHPLSLPAHSRGRAQVLVDRLAADPVLPSEGGLCGAVGGPLSQLRDLLGVQRPGPVMALLSCRHGPSRSRARPQVVHELAHRQAETHQQCSVAPQVDRVRQLRFGLARGVGAPGPAKQLDGLVFRALVGHASSFLRCPPRPPARRAAPKIP